MGKLNRLFVAAIGPLLLTACLWSPGKFTSELTLRKNGTYTLDYKGEILLQLPESGKDREVRPWSDAMARCFDNGETEVSLAPPSGDDVMGGDRKAQPCSAEQVAGMKADHDRQENQRIASKRQETEEMTKIFGLPGSDEDSNRKFAATLMKYKGWRSVAYQGKGKFLVDYHAEGSLKQDVVFPMIPDSDMIIPFVAMRRRADGSVLVSAPAFTGGTGPFGARAKMMGIPDNNDGPKSFAQGRFTVFTDGEILTNNSEDGATPHSIGRQLIWDVNATSTKLPEALIKL